MQSALLLADVFFQHPVSRVRRPCHRPMTCGTKQRRIRVCCDRMPLAACSRLAAAKVAIQDLSPPFLARCPSELVEFIAIFERLVDVVKVLSQQNTNSLCFFLLSLYVVKGQNKTPWIFYHLSLPTNLTAMHWCYLDAM